MLGNRQRAPRIVGTGLVALDVVYRDRDANPAQISTGGTCGNVLAILASLGWHSVPLARFADDPAREHIAADLARWHVDTSFLTIEPATATPIIIEHLTTKQGQARHSFSWNCPCCGGWLPRYSPVPARSLGEVVEELPDAQVFFFDRPSPGALKAAAHYEEKGALVVFEPSVKGKPETLSRALELAHVVKYADERMEHLPVSASDLPRLILEIQTRGKNGLRYRCTLRRFRNKGWRLMGALHASQVLDTVGCGDWCTAGLLARIGEAGVAGLRSMRVHELHDALQYGQALAAWNCGFLGARGGMYERTAAQMKRDIARILKGRANILGDSTPDTGSAQAMMTLCTTCRTSGERASR